MNALKISIVVLVVLVFSSVLILWSSMSLLNNQYTSHIATLQSLGKPTSLQDLSRNKIPDSENAAVIFNRVFQKMDESSRVDDFNLLRNSFMNFWMVRSRFMSHNAQYLDNLDEIQPALERNKDLFKLAEIGLERKKCRFYRILRSDGAIDQRLLLQMRDLSQLFCLKASVSARSGDMTDAYSLIRQSLKYNNFLKNEPTTFVAITRLFLLNNTANTLIDTLHYGNYSEEQAKAMFDEMGQVDYMKSFITSLEDDRAYALSMYEKMPCESFHVIDKITYLNTIQAKIDISKLSYREAFLQKKLWKDQEILPDFPTGQRNFHSFNRVLASRDSAMAMMDGSRIVLALQVYKNRYGSYPAALKDIKTKLGWKLPIDPFGGKDFTYHRKGNGFIVYSLGQNLKDDGGLDPRDMKAFVRFDQGDIVWKMDH